MDLDYFVLSLKNEPGLPKRRGGLESAIRSGSPQPFDELNIPGGALESAEVQEPLTAGSLALESTALSEAQAQDAARDPDNIIAPVMPVELIQPLSAADAGGSPEQDAIAQATAANGSWGIGQVGADISSMTGTGVTVAVLDTGIDAAHAAFAGVNITSQDFTGGGSAADRHGHGTHCAGTVFGRDVGGVRIGVARGVTNAIIGKVLDDSGRGSTTAVLKALHWAGQQGANVVSMSLGFDFPGMQQQLQQAGRPPKLATSIALKAYRENLRMFDTLLSFLMQENPTNAGMVVVAASGNESMRKVDPNFVIDTSLPAASSANIVSVGAAARAAGNMLDIAAFSNVNPVLCAPGVDIVSAKPGGGLVSMNGTSMACPHVAGLAALWWQWSLTNMGRAGAAAVRAQVVASARPAGFLPTVTFADRGNGIAKAPA